MRHGFIIPIVNFLIQVLFWCNLVEYFKIIAQRIGISLMRCSNEDAIYACRNFGIDVYQVFKWSVLFLFWGFEVDGTVSMVFILYLIGSNVFSYFYFHTWEDRKGAITATARNRRYLYFLSAICFYILCYAYLYDVHYAGQFDVEMGKMDAIYYSIAKASNFTYSDTLVQSESLNFLALSELLNSFLFITLILSNSIPTNKE